MKRISNPGARWLRCGINGVTASAGAAADGSWYVMPQANALWLDDDRLADDDIGVTLAFGRNLNQNWDFEFTLFGSEHDRAGDDSLDIQGFGLVTKRVFYRDGRVNPFLSFGLGRVKSILKPGPGRRRRPLAPCLAGACSSASERRATTARPSSCAPISGRGAGSLTMRTCRMPSTTWRDWACSIHGVALRYARRLLDSDGDGVTDDLDQCPGTPAGTPVDSTRLSAAAGR